MANMYYGFMNTVEEILSDYESEKREPKGKFKIILPPYNAACFASWGHRYIDKKRFFFGMFFNKKIEKLIDYMNENLKNIYVYIIKKETYKVVDLDLKKQDYVIIDSPDPYYILGVSVSDEYDLKGRFVTLLAIGQFLRVYCKDYGFYNKIHEISDDEITTALNIYNTVSGLYGCWSGDVIVTKEEFLWFDDPAFINKCCKGVSMTYMPYMSSIIGRLRIEKRKK